MFIVGGGYISASRTIMGTDDVGMVWYAIVQEDYVMRYFSVATNWIMVTQKWFLRIMSYS